VLGDLGLPLLGVPVVHTVGPAVGADLEAGLLGHLPSLLLHQGHAVHQEDGLGGESFTIRGLFIDPAGQNLIYAI
jgi:hypothetical protein